MEPPKEIKGKKYIGPYDNEYYHNYRSATEINLDRVESFREMKLFIEKYYSGRNVNILDIGCGIGYLTNYLNQLGTATGVDISPEAVKVAKSLYPKVQFVRTDIIEDKENALPAPFDVVVCYNIVEHLMDPQREKLFERIRAELLSKEGIFILGYADPYHPIQLVWGFLTQKVLFDKTHVHNWSVRNFRKVIEKEFEIIDQKKTSPFTKMIWFGRYAKGDLLLIAKNKM